MKNFISLFIITCIQIAGISNIQAQCPVGSATASNNWDYLDYFSRLNTLYTQYPNTTNPYLTAAMATTQKFAFGKSYFTITVGGALQNYGDTALHTGEAGSYGTGEDIRYAGNGTITITFADSAANIKFSLYDLDVSHAANITATSPTGIARTVTLGGTGTFTYTGNPGTSPTATSAATAVAVTATTRNLNVDIAGTVKTLTITFTGTGDAEGVFLSDISGCVWGSFPTNYYNVAKPFTGMAAYGLAASDTNIIHVVDLSDVPAVGVVKEVLFQEPGFTYINSMAYDPYQHNLYYVEDGRAYGADPSVLTSSAANKAVKMYDYNTETTSTLIADLTTLNIPVFDIGVQSASATFYGGCLYLGVETSAPTTSTPRENIIWRIEISGTTIVSVCQVFAFKTHNAGLTQAHNWGDIVINNGEMVDFNAIVSSGVPNGIFSHFNLQTAQIAASYPGGSTMNRPKQAATRWDGIFFNLFDSISKYNGTGALGTKTAINGFGWKNGPANKTNDATGPFKPKTDFGDAPSSYDAVTIDPATHLRDTALHLGAIFDREWTPMPSVFADGDGADEDGLLSVSVLASNPTQDVNMNVAVYNNTGAAANLVAWLDYNKNNVFDASEGRSITVTSMAAMQVIPLSWININTATLVNGDLTYLRIRLSTAAGLTTATPTGYFLNGEVEDYPIIVDMLLPAKLLRFDAYKNNEQQVKVAWDVLTEAGLKNYEVQYSTDQQNWITIGTQEVSGINSGVQSYTLTHYQPQNGKNYYRLKINELSGIINYGLIKSVQFQKKNSLQIMPNPAHASTKLVLFNNSNGEIKIEICDMPGRTIQTKREYVQAGNCIITLNNLPSKAGIYNVRVIKSNQVAEVCKLIIN